MTVRLSRVAWLLAMSTAVTALVGALATYRVAGHEFRELVDDDLKQQSKVLAAFLDASHLTVGDADVEELLDDTFPSDGDETHWVTVYDLANGHHASNLSQHSELRDNDNGSIRRHFDEHDWQGYQSRNGRVVVQLLRRDDRFEDAQADILDDIATPILIVGGINLLLLAGLVALTLWPLSRLAGSLERRSAYSLATLDMSIPTHEIALVRDTLNRLMRNVDDLLHRERQFTSDVAHELRTPLTTLKLELASNAPDLPALKSEVDRLANVVTQLLTLARVEQGQWRNAFDVIDLAEICNAEVERMRNDSQVAAGLRVAADLPSSSVRGDKVLLQVLVQNLLSNVLRHCPTATVLTLRLALCAGSVELVIEDNGPGMDADRLKQLNAGLGRLDSRGEGLGLGLVICRKIAAVHAASLSFLPRTDGNSGLRVLFRLASAAP